MKVISGDAGRHCDRARKVLLLVPVVLRRDIFPRAVNPTVPDGTGRANRFSEIAERAFEVEPVRFKRKF